MQVLGRTVPQSLCGLVPVFQIGQIAEPLHGLCPEASRYIERFQVRTLSEIVAVAGISRGSRVPRPHAVIAQSEVALRTLVGGELLAGGVLAPFAVTLVGCQSAV